MSDDRPVVVVTGTSRGIGRYLVHDLVERGYDVIGCSRSEGALELEHYVHRQVDVTQEDEVGDLFAWIRKRRGTVWGVVNNVGAAAMNHSLLTPGATLDRLLSTNVRASFLVSREAAKLMRVNGGRIVNVSSVSVPLRLVGECAYVTAKAAVERMSQVLAQELAPMGITVNVVGPAPVDTDMTRGVPKEKMDELVGRLALRRLGVPEDVANVVEFFLRPESHGVTSQVLYLGGVSN